MDIGGIAEQINTSGLAVMLSAVVLGLLGYAGVKIINAGIQAYQKKQAVKLETAQAESKLRLESENRMQDVLGEYLANLRMMQGAQQALVDEQKKIAESVNGLYIITQNQSVLIQEQWTSYSGLKALIIDLSKEMAVLAEKIDRVIDEKTERGKAS